MITGNYAQFEDETAAIAEQAMDRMAQTDEVGAGEPALLA